MQAGESRTFQNLFDIFLAPHTPNNHVVHLQLSLAGYASIPLSFISARPPSNPWVAIEEDFESGQIQGSPVLGWSQVQISGSNQWLINSQEGYLGGNCAAIQGISSAWIYKAVELTAGRPYKLRFRYKSTTATSTNYRIHFAVHNTAPTNITTWGTELYNSNIANTAWQLYNGTNTFTPSVSGTYFFGFRANLINHSTNFIYVDNVEFLYEEDLSVQSISVAPQDAFAGSNLTISAVIRNNSIAVQNKELSFYRGTLLLGTMPIASLAQNASTTIIFSTTATAGTGLYRAELPPDTNLANNSQSASFYVFPATYGIQSFESSLQFPAGWVHESPWIVNNTASNRFDGNNYAVFDNGNTAHTNKKLYTAALFRNSEDRIRFYYKTHNSPNSRIQFSMDGLEWTTLRQLPNTSNVWTMHQVLASELPTPHTGIRYIAITSSTGTGYHYTFIDKVIFESANVAAPTLSISENTINFGNVDINTISAAVPIVLSNGGGSALQITELQLANPNAGFILQSPALPISLYQNDSVPIYLSFDASVHGIASTDLLISSNVGSESISLHAYAWSAPALSAYCGEVIFEDTYTGTSSIEEIVFYNSGDGVLTLQEGDIHLYFDERDGAFEIIDANIYPIVLSFQQTASLQVSFSPLSVGSYSSALIFERDSEVLLSIPLSGNGIASLHSPEAVNLQISRLENTIILSWEAVLGALAYRIESSDLPNAEFSVEADQNYQFEAGIYTWQAPVAERRFYRVISIGR